MAVSIPCRSIQQDRSCLDHQPVDHSHSQVGGTCTGHTGSWQNRRHQDHLLLGHSHTQGGRGAGMCNPDKVSMKNGCKQAGAELCQAQVKLGLTKLDLFFIKGYLPVLQVLGHLQF